MNHKIRHRHWPLGWVCCLFRPCDPALAEETRRETYRSFEDRKAELRAAVEEERERLYALIDNGADVDNDPLLGHIARNRGTLKGPVRRVPSGEIIDDMAATRRRAQREADELDRETTALHIARAEAKREERLDRLRRGII